MGLLQFLTDNIAILLVAFVLLIAVILVLANKLMGPSSGTVPELGAQSPLDQSPAAKAFRKQLKEINLDLDKS
ncbi:MAG: hypothetical protein GX860_08470 [Alcaligenaceae bacterium]|jgi:beta-lactam-binding protein with PASTA domain|nr:hypothetical protein [Alcaligenaceae bacterium]